MRRILKRNKILSIINGYMYDSYLPININYLYNIGSILALILFIQIISGIYLATYYVADINLAFDSIEYIMREVPYGYMIRYIHSNGAAFFFICVYIHIARGLLYGSYTRHKIGTWYFGILILFLLILTAFLGYSLVFGQMSYWAIAVITNLLSVIPYFGKDLVQYIYGGFNISNVTLTRFFALHYLLPFLISLLSILHLITLHNKGGSNPLGLNSVRSFSFISFHPYFSLKDFFGFSFFFFFFSLLLFFSPNLLGHPDNYIPANPLVTPSHITPEFYLLYYYMGLRAIENKTFGVLILLSFLFVLFLLPFLHKGILSSSKFRPLFKFFLFLFFFNFFLGIFLGGSIVSEPFLTLSKISTFYYFFFFLFIFPFLSFLESFFFILLSSPKT